MNTQKKGKTWILMAVTIKTMIRMGILRKMDIPYSPISIRYWKFGALYNSHLYAVKTVSDCPAGFFWNRHDLAWYRRQKFLPLTDWLTDAD